MDLEPGKVYSWEELGGKFGFKPAYLSAAGGMAPSNATNSVLLITHADGGKAFDYGDYWDGPDLVYTGRGLSGPQKREGANRDVAENRRRLFAFEGAGPRRLRYLGAPRTVEERWGRAPGKDGVMRRVLLFRLRFADGEGVAWGAQRRARDPGGRRQDAQRTPRPFDPSRAPAAGTPSASPEPEPEEILARQEKATAGHHALLSRLHAHLLECGWSALEEIPLAIDLRGRNIAGERVIFEAKTIVDANALSQCRSGLAQLLEYREEYGDPTDLLCLAVNADLPIRRARLLDALGVGVVVVDNDGVRAGNDRGSKLLAVPFHAEG